MPAGPIRLSPPFLLSYPALLAVIFLAPFERLEGTISLLGQVLTLPEIGLALALGLWLLERLRSGRLPRVHLPVGLPLLLLVSFMLASSLLVSGMPAHSLRFTGRLLAGFLLLLLMGDVLRSRRQLRGLLGTAALAGTLVAALGILELLQIPSVLRFLESFRRDLNYAGAEIRVSSTLQYPTITAMYLKVAFCWGLGLLLEALRRRRWRSGTLLFLGTALMGTCILLTLTRASVLTLAALFLGALGLWSWRRVDGAGMAALTLLFAVLAGVFLGIFASSSDYRLRLSTVDQGQWYRVDLTVPPVLDLITGEVQEVEVRLSNRGLVTWRPDGEAPFRLSYHWFSEDGRTVVDFEGLRTELPSPVPPGASLDLRARIRAPLRPGRYRLVWDLVQEGLRWFSEEAASQTVMTRVEVTGPARGSLPSRADPPVQRPLVERAQLWRIALRMWLESPIWGIGPDQFRYRYTRFAQLGTENWGYHSHNLLLEFLANGGVLGLGLLAWALTAVLGILKRLLRQDPSRCDPIVIGLAFALMAILVHGMFDFFLGFTPTYLMIFATLGLVVAAGNLYPGAPGPEEAAGEPGGRP